MGTTDATNTEFDSPGALILVEFGSRINNHQTYLRANAFPTSLRRTMRWDGPNQKCLLRSGNKACQLLFGGWRHKISSIVSIFFLLLKWLWLRICIYEALAEELNKLRDRSECHENGRFSFIFSILDSLCGIYKEEGCTSIELFDQGWKRSRVLSITVSKNTLYPSLLRQSSCLCAYSYVSFSLCSFLWVH